MTTLPNLALATGLPAKFRVCAPDAALPEILPLRRLGEFDGSIEIEDLQDGDAVLIRVNDEEHLRLARLQVDGHMVFTPSSAAEPGQFQTFSTTSDKVLILAVLTCVIVRPCDNIH
jgi:hypothetical protein